MSSAHSKTILIGEENRPQCRLTLLAPGLSSKEFVLDRPQYRLGRHPHWSDFPVPDEGAFKLISSCHCHLREEQGSYRIFDGDGQGNPSSNGLLIRKRKIDRQKGYLLRHGDRLEIGQDPHRQILLLFENLAQIQSSPHPLNLQEQTPITLTKDHPVVLGRNPQFQGRHTPLVLESPLVSRTHAVVRKVDTGRYEISDLSTNGTFINHQKVNGTAPVKDNDVISIGPFSLLVNGDVLALFDQGKQIRLDAHDLYLPKGHQGKTQAIETRLNHISLAIEPGQLVAIIGGSGAGKSTLLKTLLGIEGQGPSPSAASAPNPGQNQVYLNGQELHQNFERFRSQIGYVPQDDIVHGELTVLESVGYSARLRLPPGSNFEQEAKKAIALVELEDVLHRPIQYLSGGQRKRVSIAVELLADPRLFFLDEPTSGLDPGLDLSIMQLLKKLTTQGRTVVLVTHATGNLDLCDRLVIVGRGGNLCYFGPPGEPLYEFFQPHHSFSQIYQDLDPPQAVEQWRDRFQNHPFHQQYIQSVLDQETQNHSPAPDPIPQGSPWLTRFFSLDPRRWPLQKTWRQWQILSDRNLKLMVGDRRSLITNLITAPLAIALMTLALKGGPIFQRQDPPEAPHGSLALKVLFVFTCAALWLGLSGTVQEIVKEASIYAREKLVNLKPLSYVLSKAAVGGLLALAQSLLITAIALICFDAPQDPVLPWALGLEVTTFLTIGAALSLGLMVSSFATNEQSANSLLPLLLLPQIIFSGVLFQLEGAGGKLAWLMISHWSIGAYGSLVDVNAMIPEPVVNFLGDMTDSGLMEANPVYDPTLGNLGLNWAMLGLQIGIYLAITLGQQIRKYRHLP